MPKHELLIFVTCLALTGCLSAPKNSTPVITNNITNTFDASKQVRGTDSKYASESTDSTNITAVSDTPKPTPNPPSANTNSKITVTDLPRQVDSNSLDNSLEDIEKSTSNLAPKTLAPGEAELKSRNEKTIALFPINSNTITGNKKNPTSDQPSPPSAIVLNDQKVKIAPVTSNSSDKITVANVNGTLVWTEINSDSYDLFSYNLSTKVLKRYSSAILSDQKYEEADKINQKLEFVNSEYLVWSERNLNNTANQRFFYSRLDSSNQKIVLSQKVLELIELDNQNNLLALTQLAPEKYSFITINLKNNQSSNAEFYFPDAKKIYQHLGFEYPKIYFLEKLDDKSSARLLEYNLNEKTFKIAQTFTESSKLPDFQRQFFGIQNRELLSAESNKKLSTIKILNLQTGITTTIAEKIPAELNKESAAAARLALVDFNENFVTWSITHSSGDQNNIYIYNRNSKTTRKILSGTNIYLSWNAIQEMSDYHLLSNNQMAFIGYEQSNSKKENTQIYLAEF